MLSRPLIQWATKHFMPMISKPNRGSDYFITLLDALKCHLDVTKALNLPST